MCLKLFLTFSFTLLTKCFLCSKGSEAYVKGIEQAGLVTSDEMKEILSGLQKVSEYKM